MKITKLLPALLVLGLFAPGCATYPGTASLWIGMTRAQAIRAMGPPESVSAQGSFEYLNYTLPVNGGGHVVSRPYYVRVTNDAVESFGYGGQFTTATSPASAIAGATARAPAKKDSIRVLSVEPATLLLDRTNRVRVKLAYVLQAQPAAMISLSSNTQTPGTQLSLAAKIVPNGSGEVEIALDVSPVNWANRSDVKMLASLFPSPNPDGASSLDFVEWDPAVTK